MLVTTKEPAKSTAKKDSCPNDAVIDEVLCLLRLIIRLKKFDPMVLQSHKTSLSDSVVAQVVIWTQLQLKLYQLSFCVFM